VIALSAHALAGEREKAIAAGCDEFDTKPVEFDRLVAKLRRLLASKIDAEAPVHKRHPNMRTDLLSAVAIEKRTFE
jgi:DNA-binding response OmpR family regulator